MNTYVKQVLANKGSTVVTVRPQTTVYDAVKSLCAKHVGSLPVVDDDKKLVGIFSALDCLKRVVLEDKSARDVKVEDVMSKKLVCVDPDTSIDVCMALMTDRRIRHLPVLDQSELLVGIVSIGDLVKVVSSQQETIIRDLEKYIVGAF